MIDSVARSVDPPNLPLRFLRSECVQHRHYGRCTHSRAQQNCRVLAGSQSEAAARRADVYHVAFSRPAAEKRAANPIHFTLHADTKMVSRRKIGQRIAAKNGWFAWIDEQSQN